MNLDAATDHSGLRVMTTDECLERLGSAPIGRVAFIQGGEVVVLPVHHVMHGTDICFRTSGSSKIEAAADHDPMSYEVDDFDISTRSGWSVTVAGVAALLDDDEIVADVEGKDPMPWTIGDPSMSVWVRIRPDSITGRELEPV